ncbi:MAG: hypothetical protein ABL995_10345 [Bryobacteraceae bacterium]
MKITKTYRTGLWEAYRTSFKTFTLATEKLQTVPGADPIAQEMALAEVEHARAAHSRSRDALVPELLGKVENPSDTEGQQQAYICCA